MQGDEADGNPLAAHDLEMVWELCERTIIMQDGKVIADAPTREIFYDNSLLRQSGLEQPYQAVLARCAGQ